MFNTYLKIHSLCIVAYLKNGLTGDNDLVFRLGEHVLPKKNYSIMVTNE